MGCDEPQTSPSSLISLQMTAWLLRVHVQLTSAGEKAACQMGVIADWFALC